MARRRRQRLAALPASDESQGVEGTTEEMGAGECTQTPGAPAAGWSAAPTRLRDKCALPHGDSDVPLIDALVVKTQGRKIPVHNFTITEPFRNN